MTVMNPPYPRRSDISDHEVWQSGPDGTPPSCLVLAARRPLHQTGEVKDADLDVARITETTWPTTRRQGAAPQQLSDQPRLRRRGGDSSPPDVWASRSSTATSDGTSGEIDAHGSR